MAVLSSLVVRRYTMLKSLEYLIVPSGKGFWGSLRWRLNPGLDPPFYQEFLSQFGSGMGQLGIHTSRQKVRCG